MKKKNYNFSYPLPHNRSILRFHRANKMRGHVKCVDHDCVLCHTRIVHRVLLLHNSFWNDVNLCSIIWTFLFSIFKSIHSIHNKTPIWVPLLIPKIEWQIRGRKTHTQAMYICVNRMTIRQQILHKTHLVWPIISYSIVIRSLWFFFIAFFLLHFVPSWVQEVECLVGAIILRLLLVESR